MFQPSGLTVVSTLPLLSSLSEISERLTFGLEVLIFAHQIKHNSQCLDYEFIFSVDHTFNLTWTLHLCLSAIIFLTSSSRKGILVTEGAGGERERV